MGDWQSLRRVARQHGVVQLVYHLLLKHCRDAVPAGVLGEAEAEFYANSARSVSLAAELLRVLQALHGQGVSAIPIKGPVLASSAYGSAGLRTFVDLDLLVASGSMPAAESALAAIGFTPLRTLPPRQLKAYLRYHYCRSFVRADRVVTAEIHWNLAWHYFSFKMDFDRLWRRCGRIDLLGTAVPRPRPEDELLILCVHGCKHLWTKLGWICDVGMVIAAHPTIEWSTMLEEARQSGTRTILLVGIALAREIVGCTIPPHVSALIDRDVRVQELTSQTLCRFLAFSGSGPSRVEAAPVHIRYRERFGDRLRYFVHLARIVPGPRDRMQGESFATVMRRPVRHLSGHERGAAAEVIRALVRWT